MTDAFPPQSYEDLIRVIHDRYEEMSKTYQKIALYLTQNPNDVAVMSVNAIGEKTGIHASSFVRYAQSLGFRGFKELQAVFQRRLTTAAPGFDARVKALEDELGAKEDRSDLGFLSVLVARDLISLQDLMANISAEQISDAANMMEAADTIYLLGQLRSAPVAELRRYMLTMLGKRTVLLDAGGGLATHIAKAIQLGDGIDPSVGMGPLINAGRLVEMEKIVAGAVKAGAQLVHGGGRAGFNAGHFFEPTVLVDCTDEMGVMAEENFGPITAITRFASEDEVLARANASDMGLSAYAFTQNPKRARRTVAKLKAGMVGINSLAMATAEAPFGGTNHSGMGREGGIEAIRDYLDVKSSQMVWA